MEKNMVNVYFFGKKYSVPAELTIMTAMEYAGYTLKRGCGCRHGFCGACATIYRIKGENELKTCLACQTQVQEGMYVASIPFFPTDKRLYNIEDLKPNQQVMMELYPEIYSCIGCNACTKACTQDLNVMQYIAYAQRGELEKCAEESFDCVSCGCCSVRCPAGISHPMVGLLARRLTGKYIAPKSEHLEKRVEEILAAHNSSVLSGEKSEIEAKILVLPEFVPCQKQLRETDIAFIIFPSNRGGYCIQPLKKEHSLNYKCSFPENWLGLERDELKQATGLTSANFCHKGGFIMTVDDVNDAISACKISLENFTETSCIINLGGSSKMDEILKEIPHMENAAIIHCDLPKMPALTFDRNLGEISMEKEEFASYIKDYVKGILKYKPDAVYVEGELFIVYPVIRVLHKKHIPVYIKHQNRVVAI